jgi:large subunit ribosomal protein L3
MHGIIGRKIEMTQVFDDRGALVPVTAVQAGPCVVTQVKSEETDGYQAVQLGLLEPVSRRRYTKPLKGHVEKAGAPPVRILREFPIEEGDEGLEPGAAVRCDLFEVGDLVDVTATSKGKGFAGVIKRHGFHGGRATHGSMFHRAPGSIGAAAYPARVWKGQKMPGRLGGKRVTVQRLEVVKVDLENHIILVKGAVPGGRNAVITLSRSRRQRNTEAGNDG